MPKYRLASRYWDGVRLYKRGDVGEFEKGKAPRGAELLDKEEPETEHVSPDVDPKNAEPAVNSALPDEPTQVVTAEASEPKKPAAAVKKA